MRLRRRPFAELIDRQLELFALDHAELLADCDESLREYDDAPPQEAEERYGDYADLVDNVREALELVRDGYAASLDELAAPAYEAAFNDAARKRFPRHALEPE